ncbi:ankyrin repeat domain-containing protein [Saprospira grandis]|uniref:Ankyrin n=1 Tax=Saprospira grandis (strain Lewin) TaxID=984262 RepID=H6L2W7_SAPGL|nr:ankyrin repeat domain-containing protein [Saprospira grandis]AFC23694.1 ankyrin [Saprospira grandis str. Lewin]
MKNYLYLFLFLLSTQFLSAQKEAAFEAVRQGDLAKLQTLLKEDPTLLQAQNARGHNLLILAAYYEQADILAQLIKAGANLDHQDASGNTALMGVCFKGYAQALQQLIEAGATVDQENYNGATALTFAVTFGHEELAKALLDAGANPEHKDQRGMSIRQHAELQGDPKILALLAQYPLTEKDKN